MSDPVEKAKDFAKAIVESDEYKKFVQCNMVLQENTSSKRLLAQYQSKQRRLRLGRFEPGLMDELKSLHDKVAVDETIQSFNKSRAELTELLVETDDLISAKIGRRFAFTSGGAAVAEKFKNSVVLAKAGELADALMETSEFKEGNDKRFTLILAECNMVITTETRINYSALGKKQGSCCG